MVEADQQWDSWVRRLAAGDEQVAVDFWQQYGARLQGLAAEYLTSRLYRRVEPEDIVQSVCRTFLVRAREGQFHLADSDSLWRLLCAITLTKVRQKARFHGRQKRSFQREASLDTRVAGGLAGAAEPTPAEAAEFADQLEQLLAGLEDEERQIILLRLEQYTLEEVAERLGCSERTVRRILKRVQSRLQRLLEEC
jgi:RNA polymerase sigma factor (sigma-70 family)